MSFKTVGPGTSLRRWRAHELATQVDGVDSWLPITPSLERTHPQVFHTQGRAELVALFAGERIACHAATREIQWLAPDDGTRATLVGGISTAAWAHDQGFASEFVRQLTDAAITAGRDAIIITSTDEQLDANLSLEPMPAGSRIDLRVPFGHLAPGIRPAQAGDVPAIHSLHAQKAVRVARDLHDVALALSPEPMTTMVLERDGNVVSYACNGRGLDLVGIWHECGGRDEDVATLILGATTILGHQHATLLLPDYRQGIAKILAKHTDRVADGSVSWCRRWDGGEAPLVIEGLDLL